LGEIGEIRIIGGIGIIEDCEKIGGISNLIPPIFSDG
jgi:hypothetical protein